MHSYYESKICGVLDEIAEEDKVALTGWRKLQGAATCCVQCRKNKPVGLYPFWHRYARELCSECAESYIKFLRDNHCYDPELSMMKQA